MQVQRYNDPGGKIRYVPVVTEEEIFLGRDLGFCVACGADTDGVEPDTRKRRCSSCGEFSVYGLEELVVRGLFEIEGEENGS